MSVTPTRLLNKQSPLSDMTMDQMLLVHGEMPSIKEPAPPRYGKPLSAQDRARAKDRIARPNPNNKPAQFSRAPREIQSLLEQHSQDVIRETLEAKKKHRSGPAHPQTTRRIPAGPTSQPSSTPNRPASAPGTGTATQAPSSGGRPGSAQRPGPGKAHVLVSPTPADQLPDDDISMQSPCSHVVDLIFEVEGVGTIAYPMYCEVLGRHPNQPHMMKVYGVSQDPADPDQDVFVGWGNTLGPLA